MNNLALRNVSSDANLSFSFSRSSTATPAASNTTPTRTIGNIKKKNIKNLFLLTPKESISEKQLSSEPTTPSNRKSFMLDHKSNPYNLGPRLIMKNFYLGNEKNANNKKTLEEFGIKLVINVAKEINKPETISSKKGNCTYEQKNIKLGWTHEQENILSEFQTTFPIIDEYTQKNKNVLIHCQLGVSRSASLVIGYVMYRKRLSFENSYKLVKQKSDIISPNMHFITQLYSYEKQLLLYNNKNQKGDQNLIQKRKETNNSNKFVYNIEKQIPKVNLNDIYCSSASPSTSFVNV